MTLPGRWVKHTLPNKRKPYTLPKPETHTLPEPETNVLPEPEEYDSHWRDKQCP
jgi:hypothetical protein